MKFFEEVARRAPDPVKCKACGVVVATVALPDFKPGRMLKTLNGGLSLLLDMDVDLSSLDPQELAISLDVKCMDCSHG